MIKKKLTEKTISPLQLIGILGGIFYTLMTETGYFSDLNDILKILVFCGFALFCAVTGVRGSLKDVLKEVKTLLEKPEVTIDAMENLMHLIAIKAGLAWESLNAKSIKIMRKQAKKEPVVIPPSEEL